MTSKDPIASTIGSDIPLTEEYNRIDAVALASFPRISCPVDLYLWQADIASLYPIYRAGEAIDRHQRQRFRDLCEAGCLYFSRSQIEAYTACVGNCLESALEDPNLNRDDHASLLVRTLADRQTQLFRNPLSDELGRLQSAIKVLCSYLRENPNHLTQVVREVHAHLIPERRRVNASLLALAVYLKQVNGERPDDSLEDVAMGFFLYDIGMVKVSPMLLAKPGQLTPPEMRIIRGHPNQGVDILRRLNLVSPLIYEPVIQHHERLSGNGYPNSLSGANLGLLGRIAGVADSYCAMVTNHPRRIAMPPVAAAEELIDSDHLYDRDVCTILIRLLHDVPSD